jgi:hypothetical protein
VENRRRDAGCWPRSRTFRPHPACLSSQQSPSYRHRGPNCWRWLYCRR